MTNWNFADVWEAVADTLPGAPALIHGERRVSWRDLNSRANSLARVFLDLGVAHQDKCAQYLYNCPEYLESTFAAMKIGMAPVNTNYRYEDDELLYLWTNADARIIVFHGAFTNRIERLLPSLGDVLGWIWVDDGSGACPSWAIPYDEAAGKEVGQVSAPWPRSGDDLYLLYTGGTTGMPKGVMWRQDDLFARLNEASFTRFPDEAGVDGVRETLKAPGPKLLPACPLMHGTGAFTSLSALSGGGAVVTLPGRSFDPVELLDTVEREQVNILVIVGDAFAKPILTALDANPGRWDLSSLFAMISSGVMWSEETKQGLFRHHPNFLALDVFSSSEAVGMGSSVSSGSSTSHTAQFTLGKDARVLAATADREVEPGSEEIGVLALGGRNPLGYYKDPDKSAATFRSVGGVRYAIPGDFATVDKDGIIHVLGRGSVCINTGGEKVYPEEVEEVVKLFPGVRDVAVVGIPHERFGESIAAVVEPEAEATVDTQELVEFVRSKLAHYKVPRQVQIVDSVGRSPAGKLDYGHLRESAIAAAKEAAAKSGK